MKFGELLGIKQCRLNIKKCQTLEDLFLKIRDASFEAGKPGIYRKENVIAFPAIDGKNQVQIFGENGKFTVMRSSMPALESMVSEDYVDAFVGFSRRRKKKICMYLCQKTADQINAMGL